MINLSLRYVRCVYDLSLEKSAKAAEAVEGKERSSVDYCVPQFFLCSLPVKSIFTVKKDKRNWFFFSIKCQRRYRRLSERPVN